MAPHTDDDHTDDASAMSELEQLQSRYSAVQQRISEACALHGRNRDDITLVVVSKFHPASLVLNLLALGQQQFGENKDQEASAKAAEVAEALASSALVGHQALVLPEWHFVGQLQSNKVKSVLRYASAIHSLDRPSLLQALIKEQAKETELQPIGVFIELNLTDDANRGGVQSANLEAFATDVLAAPGLSLLGVMGVASLDGQEQRDFGAIQSASEQLQRLSPEAKFISAGMSNDFETALGFGATHLRIGTAITGPRQYLT